MNKKTVLNTLIVGSIILILYVFVGHNFVKFYTGGKTNIIAAGAQINKLCNTNGACPTTMSGWQPSFSNSDMLYKDNMVYFVSSDEGADKGKKYQTFRLGYSFIMPDDWFEVQGGVGKPVTSNWKSR